MRTKNKGHSSLRPWGLPLTRQNIPTTRLRPLTGCALTATVCVRVCVCVCVVYEVEQALCRHYKFACERSVSACVQEKCACMCACARTFPGVADIEGPLTVRPTPETHDTAVL